MATKWIKKGMPVMHISNLDVVFTVEDFIYQSGFVTDNNGNKIKKNKLMGILCLTILSSGENKYEKFHSKDLIPYDIAKKGASEAFRFYSREGQYKNYIVTENG